MLEAENSYAYELQESVAHRVASEGLFNLEAFASIFAERLEEGDEVRDLIVAPVQARNQRGKHLELLAHGYDEADDSLILVVGKHFGADSATLTATEARRSFDAGQGFLEHSLSGWIQENLEMSSMEVEFANDIRRDFHRSSAVRMLLFTDGTMSNRIKSIDPGDLNGRDLTFTIWDIRRLAEASTSATGKEPVTIDFTEWLPEGLPALDGAPESDSAIRTFLAVLPGGVLAEIFRRHGSRLLESNVRTYLGTAGKINKNIQYTLKHEAPQFLAYNNGLTTTATGIEANTSGDSVVRIKSVEDWQVVNGGQTTSSLAYFIRKEPDADLSAVAVQMKLVLVQPDHAQDMVPSISRFANSQNRVNEADFFANSEYHQALERISKRLLPPPQGGKQYSSGWFYERARGQWENARRALTPAKQKEWDLRFPKTQRVVKTDWAKYQMSWMQRPHIVSKGAQANFLAFAAEADSLWENDRSVVNEQYFREGIAKAIMFLDLRSAVSAEDWYQERRGYLANIVAYSIARFAAALEEARPDRELDVEKIWREQALGAETVNTLVSIAQDVLGVLTSKDRPQANVTQWAKQEQCWTAVRRLPVSLSVRLDKELTSRRNLTVERREAARTQKFDNGMQDVERVMNIDAATLADAVSKGRSAGLLSEKENSIMGKIAKKILVVPSEAQARVVIKAMDRLASEAVVPRDAY